MMTNDELRQRADLFARQSTHDPLAIESIKAGYIKGYCVAESEIRERLKEIITYGDKLHVQSKFIVERIIKELIYNEQ